MNTYQDLLAKGQYREANRYMSRQEGLCGFFADYLNALENRIYHLQEYLLQKPPKQQFFLYYDDINGEGETAEPSGVNENTIWI